MLDGRARDIGNTDTVEELTELTSTRQRKSVKHGILSDRPQDWKDSVTRNLDL